MAHSFKSVSELAESFGYELHRGNPIGCGPYRFHLKVVKGARKLPFITLADVVWFIKHRHRHEIHDVSPCRPLFEESSPGYRGQR